MSASFFALTYKKSTVGGFLLARQLLPSLKGEKAVKTELAPEQRNTGYDEKETQVVILAIY